MPWVGEVLSISPSSSGDSLADTTLITLLRDTSTRGLPSTSSDSSFEIPALNSGETLLNGSLPSTCSSSWSGKLLGPNTGELNSKVDPKVNPNITRKRERHSRTKCNSKAETRPSDIVSRREAHVLDRRLTLEKICKLEEPISDRSANTSSGESDISFQADTKPTNPARQYIADKGKLETPSLIVSTSAAMLPVSFDSSADLLNSTPPLAIRRGKKVPLSLDLGPKAVDNGIFLDYPGVPSAFQCSPNIESTRFSGPPSYPALVVDTKMTAEDMIASLQNQVRSFQPNQSTQNFHQQCQDAEKWLEDEFTPYSAESLSPGVDKSLVNDVTQDSAATATKKARSSLSSTSGAVTPDTQRQKTSIIKSPRTRNTEDFTAEKKSVRFSMDPPSTIPTNILEMKQPRRESISSSKPSTASGSTVSPTKRKPPPLVSTPASPAPKPLPPTPLSRNTRQNVPKIPSPLNPRSQASGPRPSNATPKVYSKGAAGGTPKLGERARGMTVPATPTARRISCASTPLAKQTPHTTPVSARSHPTPSITPNLKTAVGSRARSMTSAPSPALKPSLVPTRRRASDAAVLHTPTKPELLSDVQPTSQATADTTTGKKDTRKLKVGISFARRRSTFSGGNKENVDSPGPINELQGRKKDKGGKVLSLPFQGVLNLLKG